MNITRIALLLVLFASICTTGCREKTPTEKMIEQIEEDIRRKKALFEKTLKLAESGDRQAQVEVGIMYADGSGTGKDKRKAVIWYEKSAAQSHTGAQFNLGECYFVGEGVLQDYAEAAKWYQKSADAGESLAQYKLGSLYFNGQGVPKNHVQALKLYRKAAIIGHHKGAEDKLISIYQNQDERYKYGELSPKDDKEALEWIKRLALKGDTHAQYHLAIMFRHGVGCEKDLVSCYAWLNVANALGLEKAGSLMVLIKQSFTGGDQLKEAQAISSQIYANMPKRDR
jgi:TPR repeat protein